MICYFIETKPPLTDKASVGGGLKTHSMELRSLLGETNGFHNENCLNGSIGFAQ